MERLVDLKDISDGRLYSRDDLVRAGCGNCEGCSACCQGMGTSLVLDPLDVDRLCRGLGSTFQALLQGPLELGAADGIILPHMAMKGEKERCSFLNEEGRCGIHSLRPGFCRLFPLGRFYENRSFRYFLQIHECPRKNRTKVRVSKWLDTPDIGKYEEFVSRWHYFLKDTGELLRQKQDQELAKKVCVYILERFYGMPYNGEFYSVFYERLTEAERLFACSRPGGGEIAPDTRTGQ